MSNSWKFAASALVGAAIAVGTVYGMALSGNLPGAGDAQMHAYLMAHPEVLADMQQKLQAQQDASDDAARQAAVDKLGMNAFFDPKLAFVTGPEDAKTTIVEFFDYNCPFCRASLPAVQKFYSQHKATTRFAFIEFPIKGPDSIIAARAALAARRQPDKYMPFHFALMSEENIVDQNLIYADAAKVGLDVAKLKADMNDPEIARAVDASLALAHKAAIDGTPAFIINGRIREGALDDDILGRLTKS
jgi:protein-disulfide isomerase